MRTNARLLGHPVHPMLIVLPLGLLPLAVAFDLLYVLRDDGDLARAALWTMTVGVAGGLVAAVFGLWDLAGIPRRTRAFRIGMLHGVGNLMVLGVFIVSLLLRWADPLYPGRLPLYLGVLGVVLALGTAWLGGELVYRLGVSVDQDAHLDASNSLRRDRDTPAPR